MAAQKEEFTKPRAAHVFESGKIKDNAFRAGSVDLARDGLLDGILLRGVESADESRNEKWASLVESYVHGVYLV